MAGLSQSEIGRYGRQLILPEWGVKGQALVKGCSVLVVGVGGLGCPSSLYLAAAGVGHIGLLDYDFVELSNLHRQILHSEEREGLSKVESAHQSISALNSLVKCSLHHLLLSRLNALEIISKYDVVLDCTDNVATRYLLNDACVLLKKPLVSGSALRFEGQLTVYHHQGGPCYRCLFPQPPPADTVTNCSEGGVLGPVPGIIGTMQALEALKIVTGAGSVLSGRMFLYDGLAASVRIVQLRSRQTGCALCGDKPSISSLTDYESFCGSCADDKLHSISLLDAGSRLSCQKYRCDIMDTRHILVDVREKTEFEICHLPNAINIPLKVLLSDPQDSISQIQFKASELGTSITRVCVCCRRGNDSQRAVVYLKDALVTSSESKFEVKDLIGGLTEWTDAVDSTFPKY